MNGPEWLCLWYLRLNGYFTLPNFIAHGRSGPLTEVDVLGVRFPYSQEFKDDSALRIPNRGIDVVFAEAKRRHISELNGPWGKPEKEALDYVLKRIGIVPGKQVAELAADVYSKRAARMDSFNVRILCFGETVSDELLAEGVTFIPWAQVLQFVRQRFSDNVKLKQDHEAWDDFGKYLWTALMNGSGDADGLFVGWDTRS